MKKRGMFGFGKKSHIIAMGIIDKMKGPNASLVSAGTYFPKLFPKAKVSTRSK